MYLIQFRLHFFIIYTIIYYILYSLFIQEIVIIKATRLQAWTPAWGARVGRRLSPPPLEKKKKVFWLYWVPFCYFFFILGPFCYVFLIFGGLFATFHIMVGAFFWGLPPPYENFCGRP